MEKDTQAAPKLVMFDNDNHRNILELYSEISLYGEIYHWRKR